MKNSFISNFEYSKQYRVKRSYIFLFVFLFIGSVLCFEMINRNIFLSRATLFKTLSRFNQQRQEDIEILFLGDSHFLNGIDTRQFSFRSFNLSFGAASYVQSYYILKHYPAFRLNIDKAIS